MSKKVFRNFDDAVSSLGDNLKPLKNLKGFSPQLVLEALAFQSPDKRKEILGYFGIENLAEVSTSATRQTSAEARAGVLGYIHTALEDKIIKLREAHTDLTKEQEDNTPVPPGAAGPQNPAVRAVEAAAEGMQEGVNELRKDEYIAKTLFPNFMFALGGDAARLNNYITKLNQELSDPTKVTPWQMDNMIALRGAAVRVRDAMSSGVPQDDKRYDILRDLAQQIADKNPEGIRQLKTQLDSLATAELNLKVRGVYVTASSLAERVAAGYASLNNKIQTQRGKASYRLGWAVTLGIAATAVAAFGLWDHSTLRGELSSVRASTSKQITALKGEVGTAKASLEELTGKHTRLTQDYDYEKGAHEYNVNELEKTKAELADLKTTDSLLRLDAEVTQRGWGNTKAELTKETARADAAEGKYRNHIAYEENMQDLVGLQNAVLALDPTSSTFEKDVKRLERNYNEIDHSKITGTPAPQDNAVYNQIGELIGQKKAERAEYKNGIPSEAGKAAEPKETAQVTESVQPNFDNLEKRLIVEGKTDARFFTDANSPIYGLNIAPNCNVADVIAQYFTSSDGTVSPTLTHYLSVLRSDADGWARYAAFEGAQHTLGKDAEKVTALRYLTAMIITGNELGNNDGTKGESK